MLLVLNRIVMLDLFLALGRFVLWSGSTGAKQKDTGYQEKETFFHLFFVAIYIKNGSLWRGNPLSCDLCTFQPQVIFLAVQGIVLREY